MGMWRDYYLPFDDFDERLQFLTATPIFATEIHSLVSHFAFSNHSVHQLID